MDKHERTWSMLPHYMAQLTTAHPWKWIIAASVSAVQYIAPEHSTQRTVVAVLVLIGVDTLSGMVASLIEGHGLKSGKAARLLVKLLGYLCVVIACSVALDVVPFGTERSQALRTLVVDFVLWGMVLSEAISVLENVVRMKVPVPSWLVRMLKGRLAMLDSKGDELADKVAGVKK